MRINVKAYYRDEKAVTLLELIVIIIILTVVGSVAVIKVTNAIRNTIVINEKATMVMLGKAAINYNAVYDRWYGANASEDIFKAFLDNPPPTTTVNANSTYEIIAGQGDGKNWRLCPPEKCDKSGSGYFCNGNQECWAIACPHYCYFGCGGLKGLLWVYNYKTGKMENSFLSNQSHPWE